MTALHSSGAPQTEAARDFARDALLAEAVRGRHVESVYRGSIAVCNDTGTLLAGAGNVHERVYLRSGAKPYQAMAPVLAGAVERFGLSEREIAIMCASHTGRPYHLEAVLSVLAKIGLDESALQCGTHPPLDGEAAARRWRAGLEPTPVCNNCSGAHAGMLAACVASAWPVHGYGHPDHPLQAQIRHLVGAFAGVPQDEIGEGVDNCSVPTFRLTLTAAATAFARLASGGGVSAQLAAAAAVVRRAMTSHPDVVAGEGRFDADLMLSRGGALVSKGGAEGFQGIGDTIRRLGLALKISAGVSSIPAVVTMRSLDDLDILPTAVDDPLDEYRQPALHAAGGDEVGRIFPVFHLAAAR